MRKTSLIIPLIALIAASSIVGVGYSTWFFINVDGDASPSNFGLLIDSYVDLEGFELTFDYPKYLALEEPIDDDSIFTYEGLDANGYYDSLEKYRTGLLFLKESEISFIYDESNNPVSLLNTIDSSFNFSLKAKDDYEGKFLRLNEGNTPDYDYVEFYLGCRVYVDGVEDYTYLKVDDSYKYVSTTSPGKNINYLLGSVYSNYNPDDDSDLTQELLLDLDIREFISFTDEIKNAFETIELESSLLTVQNMVKKLSEYSTSSSGAVVLNNLKIQFYLTIKRVLNYDSDIN